MHSEGIHGSGMIAGQRHCFIVSDHDAMTAASAGLRRRFQLWLDSDLGLTQEWIITVSTVKVDADRRLELCPPDGRSNGARS